MVAGEIAAELAERQRILAAQQAAAAAAAAKAAATAAAKAAAAKAASAQTLAEETAAIRARAAATAAAKLAAAKSAAAVVAKKAVVPAKVGAPAAPPAAPKPVAPLGPSRIYEPESSGSYNPPQITPETWNDLSTVTTRTGGTAPDVLAARERLQAEADKYKNGQDMALMISSAVKLVRTPGAASAEALEKALVAIRARQAASGTQAVDSKLIKAFDAVYDTFATSTAAKYNSMVGEINSLLGRNTGGKYNPSDANIEKINAILASSKWKSVEGEYKRLFGDGLDQGSYVETKTLRQEIAVKQREYLFEVGKKTVFARIDLLKKKGERESAMALLEDWEGGGKYLYDMTMVTMDPAKTGWTRAEDGGLRKRTVEEEFIFRRSQYMADWKRELAEAQNKVNSVDVSIGPETRAIMGRKDNTALLVARAMIQNGVADLRDDAGRQKVIGQLLVDWDKRFRPQFLGNRRVSGTANDPAYEKYMKARSEYEKTLYQFAGSAVPGSLERFFSTGPGKGIINIIALGTGIIWGTAKVIASTVEGRPAEFIFAGRNYSIKDLPEVVQEQYENYVNDLMKDPNFKATQSDTSLLMLGIPAAFTESKRAAAERAAFQKYGVDWLNDSPMGQRWKEEKQLLQGGIDVNTGRTKLEEQRIYLELQNFYDKVLGPKTTLNSAIEGFGEYGQMPFSPDSVLANLAASLVDPAIAVPLKFWTWGMRAAYAAQTTKGLAPVPKAARAFVNFQTVNEAELRFTKFEQSLVKGLTPENASARLEASRAALAGIKDLKGSEVEIKRIAVQLGLEPNSANARQYMSLAEDLIKKRFEDAGVVYTDVAAQAKKLTDERMAERAAEAARVAKEAADARAALKARNAADRKALREAVQAGKDRAEAVREAQIRRAKAKVERERLKAAEAQAAAARAAPPPPEPEVPVTLAEEDRLLATPEEVADAARVDEIIAETPRNASRASRVRVIPEAGSEPRPTTPYTPLAHRDASIIEYEGVSFQSRKALDDFLVTPRGQEALANLDSGAYREMTPSLSDDPLLDRMRAKMTGKGNSALVDAEADLLIAKTRYKESFGLGYFDPRAIQKRAALYADVVNAEAAVSKAKEQKPRRVRRSDSAKVSEGRRALEEAGRESFAVPRRIAEGSNALMKDGVIDFTDVGGVRVDNPVAPSSAKPPPKLKKERQLTRKEVREQADLNKDMDVQEALHHAAERDVFGEPYREFDDNAPAVLPVGGRGVDKTILKAGRPDSQVMRSSEFLVPNQADVAQRGGADLSKAAEVAYVSEERKRFLGLLRKMSTENDLMKTAKQSGNKDLIEKAEVRWLRFLDNELKPYGLHRSTAVLGDDAIHGLAQSGLYGVSEEFIPVGQRLFDDVMEDGLVNQRKLDGYYETFTLAKPYASDESAMMVDPMRFRDDDFEATILDPLFRASFHGSDFARMMSTPVFMNPPASPKIFRDTASNLFQLFHLNLLDGSSGLVHLRQYKRVIDALLGADPDNIYGRMWRVMEVRAGVPWATGIGRGFIDSETLFQQAAISIRGAGIHPNLALAMIPYGPLARAAPVRYGLTQRLRGMLSSVSDLFAVSPAAWDDTVVADQITIIADGMKKISSAISERTAARRGVKAKAAAYEPLEPRGLIRRASQVIDYIANAHGDTFKRAAFEARLRDKRIQLLMASVKEERVSINALRTAFSTAPEGTEVGAAFRFKQRSEATFNKIMMMEHGSLENFPYPRTAVRVSDLDRLDVILSDAYRKGLVSHNNPGLHTLQLFWDLQQTAATRGDSHLAIWETYRNHMKSAGFGELGDEVEREIRKVELEAKRATTPEKLEEVAKSRDRFGRDMADQDRARAVEYEQIEQAEWQAAQRKSGDSMTVVEAGTDYLNGMGRIHSRHDKYFSQFREGTVVDPVSGRDVPTGKWERVVSPDVDLRKPSAAEAGRDVSLSESDPIRGGEPPRVGAAFDKDYVPPDATPFEPLPTPHEIVKPAPPVGISPEASRARILAASRQAPLPAAVDDVVTAADQGAAAAPPPAAAAPPPAAPPPTAVAPPPAPSAFLTPELEEAINALRRLTGMSEEQWVASELRKTIALLPSLQPDRLKKAKAYIKDLRRAQLVLGATKAGEVYVSPKMKAIFKSRATRAAGTIPSMSYAPNRNMPYVQSAEGARTALAQMFFRRLRTSPLVSSRVRSVGPVSPEYTTHGAELDRMMNTQVGDRLLGNLGVPPELRKETTAYRILSDLQGFEKSVNDPDFAAFQFALARRVDNELGRITGNPHYRVADYLDDRLRMRGDYYDHSTFEKHWVAVQKEINKAKDGQKANIDIRYPTRPKKRVPGFASTEGFEDDLRVVIAKAKALEALGSSPHRYNEARKIFETGGLKKHRAILAVEEAIKRATAELGVTSGKAFDDLRDKYFFEIRAARVAADADTHFAALIRKRPGATMEELVAEFERDFGFDGDPRAFDPGGISSFQQKSLEEAIKSLTGVTDPHDLDQMRVALAANGNGIPLENGAVSRAELVRRGVWSPRTGEAIEAGKTRSWSIYDEAQWMEDNHAYIPDRSNPALFEPGGKYELAPHSPELYSQLMRSWGMFSRNMEARFASGKMTREELAKMIANGDPTLQVHAARDLPLIRKYIMDRFGPIATKDGVNLIAFPQFMTPEELKPYFLSRMKLAIPDGMISGEDQLAAVLDELDYRMGNYFDEVMSGGRKTASYEDLFLIASQTVHEVLNLPFWANPATRGRDVVNISLRTWQSFWQNLVFTNFGFATTNFIDSVIKETWERAMTGSFRTGTVSARAASKTLYDLGLDATTQLFKDVREIGTARVKKGFDKFYDNYGRGEAGMWDMTVGVWQIPAQIAGKAEQAAKLRLAQSMYDEVYARLLKKSKAAGLDDVAADAMADAETMRFLKEEVSRMWPTVGDGTLEKIFNQLCPFFSYQIKNRVLFIGEALNHPAIFNWLDAIGREIERYNREEYRKKHPEDPTGLLVNPRYWRQIELPWAPGTYLDLGSFTDASRGFKPIFDLAKGEMTLRDFASTWLRFVSPSQQNVAGAILNAMHIPMRMGWRQIMDENGFPSGKYERVEVPWQAPWGGEANFFGSFWPAELLADFMSRSRKDGGLSATDITMLASRAFLFSAVKQPDPGFGLNAYYYALKKMDPDAAKAFLDSDKGTDLRAYWLGRASLARTGFTPQEVKDILNPPSEDNLWWLQTDEWRKAVDDGWKELDSRKAYWDHAIGQLTPGTDEYKEAKLRASTERYQFMHDHPEMIESMTIGYGAEEWAAKLDQWALDDKMQGFFNIVYPNRDDFKTIEEYRIAQGLVDTARAAYLLVFPAVAEALSRTQNGLERVWLSTEQGWFDLLDRIGSRDHAIRAAKEAEDFDLLDQLYLVNELQYGQLDRDVAVNYFDPSTDLRKLPKGVLGPVFPAKGLVPLVKIFPDFTSWRYNRMNDYEKAEYREEQKYIAGMQRVIKSAKSSGEFDPVKFVTAMKGSPWLLNRYFNQPENAGKREEWAWNDTYIAAISKYGQLMAAGKFDQGYRYFNTLSAAVKARYFSTHPERKQKILQNQEYMGYMKKWVGFMAKKDFAGGAAYFDSLPGWVKKRYLAKNPQTLYQKSMGAWSEFLERGDMKGAQAYFDSLPAGIKAQYWKTHPYSKAMAQWAELLEKGDQEAANKFFDSLPAAIKAEYYKGHPYAKAMSEWSELLEKGDEAAANAFFSALPQEFKDQYWAKNPYAKAMSEWAKIITSGNKDASFAYFNAMPQEFKDKYFAAHPDSKMKGYVPKTYSRRSSGGSGWINYPPKTSGSAWVTYPTTASSPYSTAMKGWVDLLKEGKSAEAKEYFNALPQEFKDIYYENHPDVKLRNDVMRTGQLALYFAASDAGRAQYLLENPEFAQWLLANDTSDSQRTMMILAAYEGLGDDDQWLKRIFREKYPEVFSVEAKGVATLGKVYAKLSANPEMTPGFEKWVAAIWASYSENLKHTKNLPKPVESKHPARMNKRPGIHSGMSAAWVRLHTVG